MTEAAPRFLIIDAADESARTAINLDRISWVEFSGDHFTATKAVVHFSADAKGLPLNGHDATALLTEIDALVLKQNTTKPPR